MAILYLYVVAVLAIAHVVYRHVNDAYKKFPGPFLARWTNAWRVYQALTSWRRKPTIIDLHQEYGEVVRIGPNVLSFAQPQALKDIYGTDKHFNKSDYYAVAAAVARGRPTPSLFSSLDTAWHDYLRRAIQPAFNMTALVQYEPFVDNTVTTLLKQFGSRFADKSGDGGIVDLPRWLHWYAFDVIGELTYGHTFGFLESASDVNDIIEETHWFLAYGYVIGQMPWLDKIYIKNPILLWLNRHGYFNGSPNPAVPWALKRQVARNKEREKRNLSHSNEGRVDLIDKFLQAKEDHPDTITDREILGLGLSMVFAGSETTAITLSAIFYYLLKNRSAYQKLQAELDSSLPEHERGTPVPFQTALKLPYLDACIKEAFRIHPAARFSAERKIPPAGATIVGREIPGGSVVGVNAWVLHGRKDVFGQNVEVFEPERWFARPEEDADKAKARLAEMQRCLFQFGTGKFNCIGQHISRLEMYKAVASLMMAFEFDLVDPEKEWTFETGSFLMVSGVDVRIRRRDI